MIQDRLARLQRKPKRLKQCTDEAISLYEANTAANPHLKMLADGGFHISTPALDAQEGNPFGNLFPSRHDVPIAQVLETVNNHCGMLGAFEHWQQTKESLRRAIVGRSPMAWAHINMLGEYDLSDEKLRDSLGILPLKSVE